MMQLTVNSFYDKLEEVQKDFDRFLLLEEDEETEKIIGTCSRSLDMILYVLYEETEKRKNMKPALHLIK